MGEEMEVSRRKEAIVLWRISDRCVSGLQVLLAGIDGRFVRITLSPPTPQFGGLMNRNISNHSKSPILGDLGGVSEMM
jgi:hypothetical protein